ncbi:hypothetical protein QJS04_geneDACA002496 [Acorus gramineus]|uniref:SKI-interacting protein SKIP SNW domain-containing protein n=1 Tax=Acorus gramineus TaxID=55184 RepID=A0AAV9AQE8_ACOGR|nr:hypothetical protein QJS04_geneDACA002496 [Acorus gramineus]
MATLKEILPKAKSTTTSFYDHSNDAWFKDRFNNPPASSDPDHSSSSAKAVQIPPYGKRSGFVPRKPEDFGDGGAFPEIHVAQYPLGMGRKDSKPGGPKILPLTVDANGNVAYDAIVCQGENASKIMQSQHRDLVPKILLDIQKPSEEDEVEKQKEIEETTKRTKEAIEKIVNVRLSAAQPKNVTVASNDVKQITYTPSMQSAAFNSGAKERKIFMVEMPVDPLEPPKFKHKRVPRASGSPPVPVMHSPPRPVTVKDQQDWKIPPCISNWKNPKGYTIPLDKRLAADGRGLQEVQINDNFAKLSEALYVAEQKAREAVAMRSKVQKELLLKEKERKEQELRALAQKARSERTGVAAAAVVAPPVPMDSGDEPMPPRERETKEEREERLKRDKLREERTRERERENRLKRKNDAMGGKSKITRDRDRDISEKIALGQANTGANRGGEVMYDQRLFNQEKGMESGFAADDQYNIYDKGLFTAQPTLSTLYRPKKDVDSDTYGGENEQMEKILKTERFKPDRAFTGTAERPGKRERPVEFEQHEEADPFGLDSFFTEVRTGKKVMDKIGSGGTMRASGGSSARDGYDDGGSGRTRVAFERGGR